MSLPSNLLRSPLWVEELRRSPTTRDKREHTASVTRQVSSRLFIIGHDNKNDFEPQDGVDANIDLKFFAVH